MKKAALFISVMIIFMIFPSYKAECISYENIIEDVLKYRGNVSEYAGSTDGDWCAFVYGRYYGDNSDYLHNLSENDIRLSKSSAAVNQLNGIGLF